MQTTLAAALLIMRLTGVTQVALGLLFWTKRALTLVPVHMAIGLAFVIAVWTLAGVAARAGVARRFALVAAGWGALVLGLGITQGRLLPGDAHWIVEVAHLLVGIAAMALGSVLAARTRTHLRARSLATAPFVAPVAAD